MQPDIDDVSVSSAEISHVNAIPTRRRGGRPTRNPVAACQIRPRMNPMTALDGIPITSQELQPNRCLLSLSVSLPTGIGSPYALGLSTPARACCRLSATNPRSQPYDDKRVAVCKHEDAQVFSCRGELRFLLGQHVALQTLVYTSCLGPLHNPSVGRSYTNCTTSM